MLFDAVGINSPDPPPPIDTGRPPPPKEMSGIDMGQTLIGLLRKSDAKVTFLVSEASKSQILCACGGHN